MVESPRLRRIDNEIVGTLWRAENPVLPPKIVDRLHREAEMRAEFHHRDLSVLKEKAHEIATKQFPPPVELSPSVNHQEIPHS